MKNWILSHKILSIVLACVLGAGVICAVVLPITLAQKHEFSAEWTTDENYHWHECITKKHTDTTEKLPHEFKEEIVKAADYGVVGEKKFTCKECKYSKTEKIPALDAKERDIKFADSVVLDKVYDGMPVSLTK